MVVDQDILIVHVCVFIVAVFSSIRRMKIRRRQAQSSSQQPLISSATLNYVTRIEFAVSKPGCEKADYVVDDGIVYTTIKHKGSFNKLNRFYTTHTQGTSLRSGGHYVTPTTSYLLRHFPARAPQPSFGSV